MTRGLCRSFGDNVVLDGLDLEVRKGEVFGFLGPNGSGKTTTIRLLLGLLRPSAGEIELFEEPMTRTDPAHLRRIGAMVESPAFYPYLSGRDNLKVLARMAGLDDRRVDETIELAGLGDGARRPFGNYSVGMRQRLGFAATLLGDPDLLILDEPTTGLDPDAQREFKELMPRLRERGKTVFISSHSLEQVAAVCSSVAILSNGKRAASGGVDRLLRASPVVRVRAADLEAAAAALREREWVESVAREEGWLKVTVAPDACDRVNEVLVASGIVAYEIRVEGRTLESIYHEVVNREAA
ncbi:MAG: ABC transporter ATP-binding protein [Dehalococcoidia bacterium]